ncbi:MAG TPA: DUF397 domain-containing protein [Streptosporangiaceae bacterium]|nr:DUF397 domain-containing protein [Streptosporangiaceae bacterium]
MDGILGSVEVVYVDGEEVPIAHKYADRMVVLCGSAYPGGDALYYTPDEWEAFILGVKGGEFDDMAGGPNTDTPQGGERVVAVRDSKDPDGPKLFLTVGAWRGLLDTIKADEHELPPGMRELLDERFR